MNKSFLVLFFKKEQKKALLFEKRSKNFCSMVDARSDAADGTLLDRVAHIAI
jgi:hypothetical protein